MNIISLPIHWIASKRHKSHTLTQQKWTQKSKIHKHKHALTYCSLDYIEKPQEVILFDAYNEMPIENEQPNRTRMKRGANKK